MEVLEESNSGAELAPRCRRVETHHDATCALSRRELFIVLTGLISAASPTSYLLANEGGATVGEYEVKAAFLYNFTKFIEWPSSFLGHEGKPFTIGVLGNDPFGPLLERTLEGKTVRGHEFRVKRFPAVEDLELCHILFIKLSDKELLNNVIETVADSPVLTVGEHDSFTQLGGIIELSLQNRRVRFAINAAAAERAGLKVSSQLLKLARYVHYG